MDRINGEIGRVQAELEEILESLTGTKEDMDRKNADIEKLQQTIDASYTSQDENKEKLEADTAKKQELSESRRASLQSGRGCLIRFPHWIKKYIV